MYENPDFVVRRKWNNGSGKAILFLKVMNITLRRKDRRKKIWLNCL